MDYLYFITPAIILPPVFIFIFLFYQKKISIIRKIDSLSIEEKELLLNEIVRPAGYLYDPFQDIFTARLDAPQKHFGYTTFYDFAAPYLNMVFDYETIYFDYQNRTWLIEMWKGQYGINTGCELGIYYADHIISPEKYSTGLFKAVDAKDMPYISMKLNCHDAKKCRSHSRIAYLRRRHWWMTIFKMGVFSKPENLFVNTSIRFHDYSMMYSFLFSLKKTLPHTSYKINGLTVYFTFTQSFRHYSLFQKAIRQLALFFCCFYCKCFLFITRPYEKSGDKILYLYYYLPLFIRRPFFRSDI